MTAAESAHVAVPSAARRVRAGSWRARDWVFAVALTLATAFAYLPALRAGFIWDDDAYVARNVWLRAPGGLARIWSDPAASPQYYPVVFTSFWLEQRAFGPGPAARHATNVALHLAAALLLWRLLLRLGVPGAALAAALFAVHPVHVESVAWITERKNVLSGCLYLAALAAYLRFDPLGPEPPVRRPALPWVASFVLFVAALGSKSVTASLPAAVLLLVYWRRGRIARRDVWPLLPFAAAGVASGLYTAWLEKTHVGAFGAEFALTPIERVLVAGRALWFYAGKLVWPSGLTFVYPRWSVSQSEAWQYLFPAAAAIVVGALFAARARIGRGPLVAVLFFAGTLVPALGFVDVYPFRFSFVADHFQYLASLGLLTLFAATIAALGARLRPTARRALAAGIAALLATLALLTFENARGYHDLETLWTRNLDRNPDSFLAHNNLGVLLGERGETAAAFGHLNEALRIKPDDPEVLANLAGIYTRMGNLDRALPLAQRSVALEPSYAKSHFNLGNVWMRLGRTDEAEASYRTAVRLDPSLALAWNNLGAIAQERGSPEEAAADFARAIALDPDYAPAHVNLGRSLQRAGRLRAARAQFERALQLAPDLAAAREGLEETKRALGE